jgi:V8-like Glu-specific endopeptidase
MAVCAFVTGLSFTAQANETALPDGRAAQIGIERLLAPPLIPFAGGSSRQAWTRPLTDAFENAQTIRIELRIEATSPGPWSIQIIDGDDTALEVNSDVISAEAKFPQSFWSSEIHAECVPRLVVTGSRSGLKFAMPSIIEVSTGLTPHVFVDGDQRWAVTAETDARIRTWARAIGSLRFIRKSSRPSRRGYFGCTASLVGPRLLLTAAHCTADADERLVIAEFEFFSEERRNAANKIVRVSTAARDTLLGRGLDYAFLRLVANQQGVESLNVTQRAITISDTLMLIQDSIEDSGGLAAKQVSQDGCHCTAPSLGPNFAHACDVINTGSGAPLLQTDGTIVGIHVGGVSTGNKSENYGLAFRTIVADMRQTQFGNRVQRELTFVP